VIVGVVVEIQELFRSKRDSTGIWRMKSQGEPWIKSGVSDLHNWSKIRLEGHVVNKVDLRVF
jgi:hypothetical protein